MDRNKILEIAKEYPSHITQNVKKLDPEFYERINKSFEGNKFTERLYLYFYGKDESVCNNNGCDNSTNFLSFSRGFNQYCSNECSSEANTDPNKKEIISCLNCTIEFEDYKSYGRKFCSNECYVEYETEHGIRKEKLKKGRKVIKEKYGGFGWEVEEIAQKYYDTMEQKYGDKYYNNREKERETKLKRYGNPEYNNRKKYKETCLERYDVEYFNNHEKAAESRNKRKYNQLLTDPNFNQKIEPLFSVEEYTGAEYYKLYSFQCKNCGEDFDDWLNNGHVPRCPVCYPKHSGTSVTEKEVCDFVRSILPDEVEVIENDRSVLGGKELDIYIPTKNIAIEFDGIYWHSEAQGQTDKNYHVNKTDECETKGIQLIHIFETEWMNQREIVKSRLEHILGVASREERVYARKCSVKEIDSEQKGEFLETYHIQGNGRSSVKIGLYYGEFFNSDLVAVMTFGTPSVAQGHRDVEGIWELKRFATSRSVVGGAGKMLKYFIRNYDPEQIITYADRRWTKSWDNVYEAIGFEEVGRTQPNYFYFNAEMGSLELIHRYKFRKQELPELLETFNSELTEWENMQLNGWDRIWDCGHLKYELIG